jgi:O-antigen/teichoic acid export membrane protein
MTESPAEESASQPEKVDLLQDLTRQFSGFSKDVLIYGIGGAADKIIAIFTVPILTRIFSVADFGTVDLIVTTVGFFSILMGLNLNSGMWRYFYEIDADDHEERKRLISSTLWFLIGLGVPVTVGIILFSSQISQFLLKSDQYASVVSLAVLVIPFQLLYFFFIGIQRLMRRPINFLALNLGYVALNFSLILLFLPGFKMGIEGVFLAQLCSYLVAMIIGLWLSRDMISLNLSGQWIKKMAAYSLPQMPGVIVNWFLVSSNRYFLNLYADVEQVGFLSAANKIAQVLAMLAYAFRMAWDPFALSAVHHPNARKIYATGLQYFLAVTLFVGAGITIFAKEILSVFTTSAYLPAVSLVGILVARHILQGASNIVGISIAISKKTIFTSIALIIAAGLNLLANLTLTAQYGVTGAALSELIGFLSGFIALYIISYYVFPVPWNLSNVLTHFFAFTVVVFISLFISQQDLYWVWELISKLALYGGFVYFEVRTLEESDRHIIQQMSRKSLELFKNLVKNKRFGQRAGKK